MSDETIKQPSAEASNRKPRLVLMGEFSAGKSTLSNLLLGADPLPVRVTATRLPPVWISYGDQGATCEGLDGTIRPLDMTQLESVRLEETRLIRLYLKSDMLRLCDLIDMPGISDPNMSSDVWQGVIGEADHVIWCTHATQAWRQSEAAVWESLPEHLKQKSLLLLTRFDKILSPRDRERVVARIKRETEGLFHALFPISVTGALAAGDNREAWEDSGAEVFVKCLIDLLMNPDKSAQATYGENRKDDAATAETTATDAQPSKVRIMPSRVRLKSGGQRRPRVAQTDQLGEHGIADMQGNA
jgi:hypothetical protein